MCNPAEQAGANYASDSKRNNVLVSEMEDQVFRADTSASVSEAPANHSDGSSVEVNEAAVPMSSASSIKANGVDGDHSVSMSKHFAEGVHIPEGGQEVVEELVDMTRKPSKPYIVMTASSAEGNGTDKDGAHIPSFHVKNSSETSEHVCDPTLVESEDDVHPMCANYRTVETKPMETETLLEQMSSETKSQTEGVQLEEAALKETSRELVADLVTPGGLPDGADGEISIKAVNATSVSGGSQSALRTAEELSVDPCKGGEKSETPPYLVHANSTKEFDDHLAFEGLAVGSEGHSSGPCTERDSVLPVNNSDVKLDADEQILIDFNEPLAWIEMRPGVAEPTTASADKSTSGAIQITSNAEESTNETAKSSLETGDMPQQSKHMTQDIAEHVPRSFKGANGESSSEIEQEDAIVNISRTGRPELAEFFSNAKGLKPEKEIEEQECTPVTDLQKKLFMESPRSLRMLLFSEETAPSTKKDEKYKKDGKSMEFSSKVVPATESHGKENHMDHSYPAKWYENSENGEASNVFSGPMAFSGALTYQGVISYSGQIPYSGSISHRSDSSASARSFAFPILASDWNSSPVKMGPPDPRFHRPRRRKWYFCFCCRRASSWFD